MSCARWRGVGIVVLAMHLAGSVASAQNVTELSLKAAVVYNLAKFTEWPADAMPPTRVFTACVFGDDAIAEALTKIVKGRLVGTKEVSVSRVRLDGPLKSCQLLYISRASSAQLAAVLAAVRGAPVLTISDIDDFATLGGVARLFVENGRIRFDLNPDVARRTRLRLSSDVLALAAHVRGGPGGDR